MYRERLTITLEAELLAAIDLLIDKQTLRNRSQTIEHLLKEGIGLHELSQAFIFYNNGEHIEEATRFCAQNGIKEILLGIPTASAIQFADAKTSINDAAPNLAVTHAPTDFGTAGALILQRAKLAHPFLVITLSQELSLPDSLLPLYVFHRQHHAPLTQLIRESSSNFVSCGVEIASPELLTSIPAGITDLRADVFPALVKEGKVRSYVTV